MRCSWDSGCKGLARERVDALSGGEPADPLALAPLTLPLGVHFQVYLDAAPMLHAFLPGADILFLGGRVGEGAVAVLAPPAEGAHILSAILPDFPAGPLHVGLPELAVVGLFEVGEVVGALPLEDPLFEVALVETVICPLVPPLSILLAHCK